MKLMTKIFLILFVSTTLWAQNEDEIARNPKAQDKIKAARIAFITERLELTPEEAERFWPIYKEFTNKRMELRQQFEQARKNPNPNKSMEQYNSDLVDLNLKLKQEELNMEKDYSRKIMDVVPAHKLMALKKAEDDFRRLVLQQIQQRQIQQQRKQQFQERNEQRLKQRNN